MLARGFKAKAARLALEVRDEVGLGIMDQLDPYVLAREYGIEVFSLTDVGCRDEVIEHFTGPASKKLSAAVIQLPDGLVIVENPSHPLARRRSSAAHEVAHVVLEHPFEPHVLAEIARRRADGTYEEEANVLGAELLLPTEAAKRLALRDCTDEEAAELFGVSVALARWRLNATGARLRARRARVKYQRRP